MELHDAGRTLPRGLLRRARGARHLSRVQALTAALARSRAEARRAVELAERTRAAAAAESRDKDDFLSTLSHELRTPLTAILGWANILRTRSMEPAAQARALATIERNARVQVQLIEDILDVSRIVTGKLRLDRRPVDPAAVVRAAVDAVRPAAEAKQVTLEAGIDDGLGPVSADPDRLQQITWNLLSNAIKFTPRGGSVALDLAAVPAGAGGLGGLGGPAGVRLQVVDSGEGIAPSFLPHVFDRFRQADGSNTRAHGGLGLGLAIVKHLVELHQGTITAASDGAGRGATFTVTLPLHPPAALAEGGADRTWAAETMPAASPRLDGLRVLIVDDEPDARELVAAILREQGADVTAAASAGEALAAVTAARPDVLVSDIGLPHEDGYALLRKVRAQTAPEAPPVPALALTAYAGAQDTKMAEQAGFQRHLAKPVAPAKLIDAVARLAGRVS